MPYVEIHGIIILVKLSRKATYKKYFRLGHLQKIFSFGRLPLGHFIFFTSLVATADVVVKHDVNVNNVVGVNDNNLDRKKLTLEMTPSRKKMCSAQT